MKMKQETINTAIALSMMEKLFRDGKISESTIFKIRKEYRDKILVKNLNAC